MLNDEVHRNLAGVLTEHFGHEVEPSSWIATTGATPNYLALFEDRAIFIERHSGVLRVRTEMPYSDAKRIQIDKGGRARRLHLEIDGVLVAAGELNKPDAAQLCTRFGLADGGKKRRQSIAKVGRGTAERFASSPESAQIASTPSAASAPVTGLPHVVVHGDAFEDLADQIEPVPAIPSAEQKPLSWLQRMDDTALDVRKPTPPPREAKTSADDPDTHDAEPTTLDANARQSENEPTTDRKSPQRARSDTSQSEDENGCPTSDFEESKSQAPPPAATSKGTGRRWIPSFLLFPVTLAFVWFGTFFDTWSLAPLGHAELAVIYRTWPTLVSSTWEPVVALSGTPGGLALLSTGVRLRSHGRLDLSATDDAEPFAGWTRGGAPFWFEQLEIDYRILPNRASEVMEHHIGDNGCQKAVAVWAPAILRDVLARYTLAQLAAPNTLDAAVEQARKEINLRLRPQALEVLQMSWTQPNFENDKTRNIFADLVTAQQYLGANEP